MHGGVLYEVLQPDTWVLTRFVGKEEQTDARWDALPQWTRLQARINATVEDIHLTHGDFLSQLRAECGGTGKQPQMTDYAEESSKGEMGEGRIKQSGDCVDSDCESPGKRTTRDCTGKSTRISRRLRS